MLDIKFEILGDQQYARAFDTFGTDAHDMREPLGRIAADLRSAVEEQFASKGARGGTPWAALNPAYERWKRAHYPGKPILRRTDAMFNALTGTGADGPIREHTESRLVWGITNQVDDNGDRLAVRAGAHQTGKGVVPARPMVALTEADRRGMDHEFVAWLNELKHRAGL